MTSNLQPGVTEIMIPGNRPEDTAWEDFHCKIDDCCCEIGIDPDQANAIWHAGLIIIKDKQHWSERPKSKLCQNLGQALNPNNHGLGPIVDISDLKESYGKLYESLESFDTIANALKGDEDLLPEGERLVADASDIAAICKHNLDKLAVRMEEIK